MSGHSHDAFSAFWESGGPWPPLALSVIVGVVTLTVGLMLVWHGTSMSSSPLILCSVTGLLIGLAMTVVLPQARPHSLTALPSANACKPGHMVVAGAGETDDGHAEREDIRDIPHGAAPHVYLGACGALATRLSMAADWRTPFCSLEPIACRP